MIQAATISTNDRAKMQGVVNMFPEASFSFLAIKLHKYIQNITPEHYMLLGYMIGYFRGAVESHEEIINNNTPCQRQN